MTFPVHELIGDSAALNRIVDFIGMVAPVDATVLLEGESGTGKELAAQAIHRNSGRAGRPFIALNCATLQDSMIVNELFGHEAEPFTGAVSRKKGRFEAAAGGTLFLDEIGELTPALQSTLLRSVELGEIQRIGSNDTIPVDVRLIAATNCDLRAAIAARQFRSDLYYRLSTLRVKLPALRDRREDIPILLRHFLPKGTGGTEQRIAGFSPAAEAMLCRYDWPGNVRELRNVVLRIGVFAKGPEILPEDLPSEIFESAPTVVDVGDPLSRELTRAKRAFVDNVMRSVNGSFEKACKLLNRHPAGLCRLLESLGLSHWKRGPGGHEFP